MMKKPGAFSARRNVVPAMSQRLASIFISVVLALAIVPTLTLAETFALPSKEIYLTSWDVYPGGLHGCGGPVPMYCAYQNFLNWYSPPSYIVYRTLISQDGSETILDYASQPRGYQKTDTLGSYRTWLTAQFPEKTLELSNPGSYRVELRVITITKATAKHYTTLRSSYVDGRSWWPHSYPTELTPDSVIDWWTAEKVKPSPDVTCIVKWNNNICWTERKTESDVKLSDKAELLEYYEITVAAPFTPPSNPPISSPKLGKSSFIIHTTDSPFNSNKGDEDIPSSAASPMLLAGMLGAAAIGATLYLHRTYSSGSSFRAFQTKAGQARAAAWAAEKANIARLKERYERMLAEQYARAQRRKRLSALTAAQTAAQKKAQKQLELELANADRYHTFEQKAAAYEHIAKKYGIEKAATVATAYKEAHALAAAPKTATATYSPQALAASADQTALPPLVVKETEKVGLESMNFNGESKVQELAEGYENNWWVEPASGFWGRLNESAETVAEWGRALGPLNPFGHTMRFGAGLMKFGIGVGHLITVDAPYALYSMGILAADDLKNPENKQRNHAEGQAILRDWAFGSVDTLIADFKRDPVMAAGEVLPIILGPKVLKGKGRAAKIGKRANIVGEAYEFKIQNYFEGKGWKNMPEYSRHKIKTSHGTFEIDRVLVKDSNTLIVEAKINTLAEAKRLGIKQFKTHYGRKIAAIKEAFPDANIVWATTSEIPAELISFFESRGVTIKKVV